MGVRQVIRAMYDSYSVMTVATWAFLALLLVGGLMIGTSNTGSSNASPVKTATHTVRFERNYKVTYLEPKIAYRIWLGEALCVVAGVMFSTSYSRLREMEGRTP